MLFPCSDWVWHLALLPPFTLFVPFVSFPFLFCLVLLCLLWVGKCGGGTVLRFPLLLPTVCVLCHGIVGLGLCFCDRVVSLRNGGGGLCWVEGRVVSAVCCQLLCVVVCVLVWCVCCLVVLCCGMAVGERECSSRCLSCLSCLSLLLSFSSSFVVGVRGSARAAMRARTLSPNTIVSSLLCSFLFSSLCSPPFFVPRFSLLFAFLLLEWRCVVTMCRSA